MFQNPKKMLTIFDLVKVMQTESTCTDFLRANGILSHQEHCTKFKKLESLANIDSNLFVFILWHWCEEIPSGQVADLLNIKADCIGMYAEVTQKIYHLARSTCVKMYQSEQKNATIESPQSIVGNAEKWWRKVHLGDDQLLMILNDIKQFYIFEK